MFHLKTATCLPFLQTLRVHGVYMKGNKMCTWKNSIPPMVPLNMVGNIANLHDLHDHLACANYFKPGIKDIARWRSWKKGSRKVIVRSHMVS